MFGDFGYVIIMFCVLLVMIYWEKLFKKVIFEFFVMVYYGCYIVFVMVVFLVYIGFIYNDVFFKFMILFSSQWEWDVFEGWIEGDIFVGKLKDFNYCYFFGFDWRWYGIENDFFFSNSYKMKMSIIFGWVYMMYFFCFLYINVRYFKKFIDIWGNFVFGMIFFQVIFGYLVVCIIYKWSVNWFVIGQQFFGLFNMFIYMFFQFGFIDIFLYSG